MQRLPGLAERHQPGRAEPAGEEELVVVDVLAASRVAGDHDRQVAVPAGLQDGGRAAVADHQVGVDHRLLQLVVAEERHRAGQPGRVRVPVLHGQPDRAGRRCACHCVQPVDEPVEGVLVGADRDQQPELGDRRLSRWRGRRARRGGRLRLRTPGGARLPGHSSVPTTVASGYCRRCSSHCTSIADRNGRQSRAVSVGVSIRSYTSM